MSLFESSPSTSLVLRAELPLSDEAHLAAAAFCARYSRRTLESYAHRLASLSSGRSTYDDRQSTPPTKVA